MSTDVVRLIAGIVRGTLDKGQSVPLHELLWTVDAQLHLIASPEEINEALQQGTPVRVKRSGGGRIELVPAAAKAKGKVTATDVDSAYAIYHAATSKMIDNQMRKVRK